MSAEPIVVGAEQPFENFEASARAVLTTLQARLPFGLWMVTRTDGNDWIVLQAVDRSYGVKLGDVLHWPDSFCVRMVRGEGPQVAPHSRIVGVYRDAPIAQQFPISAYIGVPLTLPNGELFGTLCAIDPQPQSPDIERELPMVKLQARLLATLLALEMQCRDVQHALDLTREEAQTDELTGLVNRRGWERIVAREEERCRRFGSPAGVISIDLDKLKEVNDNEGHAAGDELLRRTAEALRRALRGTDVAARIGGDEFAVLAVEVPEGGLTQLVDRVRAALDASGVSASVGQARRDPRIGLEAAFTLADSRMYEEKHARAGRRGR